MKLFISNLPFALNQAELRELLEGYGEVLSVKMIHEPGGRSRGFAFAEVTGDYWIGTLDGKSLYGRAIQVSEAVSSDQYQRPVKSLKRKRPRRLKT